MGSPEATPAVLHPDASRTACQRGTVDAIPASGEDKRDRADGIAASWVCWVGLFILACKEGWTDGPLGRADSLGYHPWGTYGQRESKQKKLQKVLVIVAGNADH